MGVAHVEQVQTASKTKVVKSHGFMFT